MSNIEEIGHLVAPFEVDNNWVCTLCGEGKLQAESIVRHSCGQHLFYCSCLTIRLIMNPLCPTCQNLGSGTIAQMNNIKIGVTNKRSAFNKVCMKCIEIISRREEHIKIYRCKHRIHKSCTLDLILEKGISPKHGSIFCPLCDSQ